MPHLSARGPLPPGREHKLGLLDSDYILGNAEGLALPHVDLVVPPSQLRLALRRRQASRSRRLHNS